MGIWIEIEENFCMPLIPETRHHLIIQLEILYQGLQQRHMTEQSAIGSRLPVGGGEWMDLFFRLEGLRGTIAGLRSGKSVQASIDLGKVTSTIAVHKWNESRKREYQVHRWDNTAHDYIESTVRRLLNAPYSDSTTTSAILGDDRS